MADSVAVAAEPEPGAEIQFCPIRQEPIKRSLRVRTLPGFHLVSLSAGREALARGYYEAFGKRFPCLELEFLHADDKVFVCAEDHKAFKNQMSMQYHRYIRHELEERKAERKRLRERAVERQARSLAHAARQQQQPPPSPLAITGGREVASDPRAAAGAGPSITGTGAAASSMNVVGMEAASQLLASGEPGAAADVATDDPYALAQDPEPPAETSASTPGPAATVPAASAAPVPAADAAAQAAAPAAAVTAPARKPIARQPMAAEEEDEDDLYGDMGGPAAKKQKSASEYTNAIGAMMTDDFDEEDE